MSIEILGFPVRSGPCDRSDQTVQPNRRQSRGQA